MRGFPEVSRLYRKDTHEKLHETLMVDMFTNFILPNVGGVVVDQLLFRFSICQSVREIFAIKVESQKKRRDLDVFALPNFRGLAFQKLNSY